MPIPRLIPVLLIHENKLQKSVRFDEWTYVGDPLNTVKIFNDKDVDEIVILNTDSQKPDSDENLEFLRTVAQECFMPIAYGGNIHQVSEVRNIVSCGVDKVVINSAFIDNPAIISEIVDVVGSSSVVVSVDSIVHNGIHRVFDHRSRSVTDLDLTQHLKLAESSGAGEILIQSVDRDGSRTEPDFDLAESVSKVIALPLVYAGGVSSLGDATKLWGIGINGVAAGSWFIFRGKLRAVLVNYPSRADLDACAFK